MSLGDPASVLGSVIIRGRWGVTNKKKAKARMGMRFYKKFMVSVKIRCLGLVYIQLCVNLGRDRVDKTKGNWELNFVIKIECGHGSSLQHMGWQYFGKDNIIWLHYLYLVFTMKSL